jgi:hypothetical protein
MYFLAFIVEIPLKTRYLYQVAFSTAFGKEQFQNSSQL